MEAMKRGTKEQCIIDPVNPVPVMPTVSIPQ